MGNIQGDTRSLDYSSCRESLLVGSRVLDRKKALQQMVPKWCHGYTGLLSFSKQAFCIESVTWCITPNP